MFTMIYFPSQLKFCYAFTSFAALNATRIHTHTSIVSPSSLRASRSKNSMRVPRQRPMRPIRRFCFDFDAATVCMLFLCYVLLSTCSCYVSHIPFAMAYFSIEVVPFNNIWGVWCVYYKRAKYTHVCTHYAVYIYAFTSNIGKTVSALFGSGFVLASKTILYLAYDDFQWFCMLSSLLYGTIGFVKQWIIRFTLLKLNYILSLYFSFICGPYKSRFQNIFVTVVNLFVWRGPIFIPLW